jgi:signal recognition particle subunit SRP54
MLDTAGRLHVDQALMDEMKAVADVSAPQEILLVVDSLTGQDAVNVAKSFTEQVPLTGVVLTRMDGDARGGAALSMRALPASRSSSPVSAKSWMRSRPSTRARGAAHPWHGRRRRPGRTRGRGHRRRKKPKSSPKMAKGQFDLNDLRAQLRQMPKWAALARWRA